MNRFSVDKHQKRLENGVRKSPPNRVVVDQFLNRVDDNARAGGLVGVLEDLAKL